MLRSLGCAFAAVLLFFAGSANAQVVVSQAYGGGGNTGAPFNRDFVELFNRGATPVSLAGHTVQYASATGTGNFAIGATLPNISLAPGQYHLVGMSSGANGAALPTVDTSGTSAMATAAGKVVVVNSASALACNGGSTPCSDAQQALIVDLVGYGNANFFEGTAAAPTLGNTLSAIRSGSGCTDTNQNGADFTAGTPDPRNSVSPAQSCTTLTPQLTITKQASGTSFTVGVPASYTLELSNTGTAATTAVAVITDTIPTGLTIGTLPAGCSAASQTVTCTVPAGLAASGGNTSFVIPVTPTLAAGTSVTNTASVTGGGDTTCPGDARCSGTVGPTPVTGTPSLSVDKTAGTPSGSTAGSTIAYTFLVTNTGNVTLTGIVINDAQLDDAAVCPVATLGPGASATCSGIHTITQAEVNAGVVNNSATATGALPGGGTTTSPPDTTSTPIMAGADLSITKSDGATSEIPGTPVTYTIVASNAGPRDVIGAAVADTFPAICSGATWSCVGAGGGTCTASGLDNISDTVNLPTGGSVTYTATCNIAASATGTLANTATVSSSISDPTPSNNSATDTDILIPPGPCPAITFPYTLPNNAPNTLSDAITCANNNGPSADTIDLNGQIVTLTAAFADYTGATGLPQITTVMTLQNGTISRSGGNQFRLLSVGSLGNLTLNQVTASNGYGLAPGAMGGGGAIYNLGALNIVGGQFNNNYSALDGGAIHNDGGAVNARYTVFSGNSANTSLGGVGGGVANSFGVVTLSNVLISGNLGVQGAGIYNNNGGTLTLNNSTIAGNSTNDQGGGLRNENTAASVVLNNTIISGNESSLFPASSNLGGSITNNFSLIGGSPAFVAPLDASSTAPTTAGNYRLADFSPAIDAGSNTQVPGIISTDLDGNPRRYDDLGVIDTGVGAPPIVDIGAYERQLDSVPPATLVQPTALTVSEAGETADTFVVSLNQTPSVNVTIQLTFDTNVVVDTGSGFGASPQTLTLMPANALSGVTVTVRAVDDAIDETSPHAALITTTATSSAQAAFNGLAVADVAAAIADDDTAGIAVIESGGATGVTEGGAGDSYSIVLTSQPTANVSIALNPGTQLTAVTSPVLFTTLNWNTPQTVTVTAVDDVIVEGNHTGTISHTVSSADAVYNGFSVANVVANISDNDLPTLAINDVSIAEGNSGTATLSFTVTRTGSTALAAGFSFASANGTATAGSDYVTASGTGTIPAGGATATTTVSVTINGDAVFENNETLLVNLTTPTNATIADAQGIGTITNDDAAPTLAINDVSIVEGNAGTSNLVFTVTRTGLTDLPASFSAASADITATSPSDYLAALTGTTSIAAGGATGTTTVSATINGDGVVEANETFFVNLSAANNATITDNQGIGTINNDDTAGIAVIESGGATGVTEGGAGDSYSIVLTSQPTANVSIALNPGTQLTAVTSPVLFTTLNWNTPQTVTVTAVDDVIVEGNHTGTISHTVSSADAVYNALTVANVTANITDNDAPGVTIVQSGGNTTAIEGAATDSYTVALTSQPSANVLIALTGTQVTTAPTSLTFTDGNWNVPQTVTVTAIDDNVVEGAHTGNVASAVTSADTNYNNFSVSPVSVAVTDNDSATVSFNPTTVSQSEASSPMAFTVTLSNPVQSGVTVTVSTGNGTAGSSDFTAINAGTVTFPANSTSAQTVNVVINNDLLDENDEQFTIALSNPVATGTVTIGAAATATGTIQDDDAEPVLSLANVSQAEGNAGTSTMNFVVNLSAVSGRDVSFTRATADGTATTANNDYVALASGSATILAGQTSVTIPVTINGDSVFEGNESFSLNISAPVNATPASLTATGTIQDDDQQPTTTTIVSDLPDPSIVGQAYAVTVQVAALTSSPPGTVSVSDGTDSCTLTVTAGTSPNSTGSCNLTSTTAGAKTLTATYTPANSQFISSSATTAHQVNAAATTISLTGPATTPLNQATNYSFTLAVTAPGAGSPAGTVVIQAGASNCTVNLPTVTPSCSLSFTAVGPQTVSATFTPSNGNFLTSSTTSSVSTLVFARADLSVTKTNGVSSYRSGDLLVYTIIARNLGPDAAPQVQLVDNVPAQLENVSWTCSASGGLFCPAAGGVGNISQSIASFPVGGQLTYTLSGNVIGLPAQISNTATLQLPANNTVQATTPANLSATDTDLSDSIFASGFEDAVGRISGPSGQFRFPSAALRTALDETAVQVYSLSDQQGEALRVYARVLDGEIQYAIAIRNTQGKLILGRFQSYATEPVLQWQAREQGGNWVFLSAAFL